MGMHFLILNLFSLKPCGSETLFVSKLSKIVYLSIRGSPAFRVCKRIKEVKKALKVWNKSHFGLSQERIKTLQNQLAIIQENDPLLENLALEKEL